MGGPQEGQEGWESNISRSSGTAIHAGLVEVGVNKEPLAASGLLAGITPENLGWVQEGSTAEDGNLPTAT